MEKPDFLKNVLPIFKFTSSPENDVTDQCKVEADELVFYIASKNVAVFDTIPWESDALTNLFFIS